MSIGAITGIRRFIGNLDKWIDGAIAKLRQRMNQKARTMRRDGGRRLKLNTERVEWYAGEAITQGMPLY